MNTQDLFDEMAGVTAAIGNHMRDEIVPKLVPEGGVVGDALIMTESGPSWEPVTIGGGGPGPVTPVLTPTTGAVTFTEDAVAASYDLAVANVTLTGVVSVTPALPAGLSASVLGTKLKVSGNTAAPVASTAYTIVVSTASGNLTYSLTLVVLEVITASGWVPSNGSEQMYFDPTAFPVPVSQKANLQALLDQHNVIRLDAGDYTGGVSGLMVKSNQKIYGIPRRTAVPGITIVPGSTGIVLRGIITTNGQRITFPASPLVTKRNVFSNLASDIYSVGGSIEENIFAGFLGGVTVDASAGGSFNSNRFLKPHSVLYGWELGTSPLGKAAFWLKGAADRSNVDGNVLIALNGLNPQCGTLYAENGKRLTVIGWDEETYHPPYNGLAQFYIRNHDKFNLMASGGSPDNTAIDTGADNNQIIHNDSYVPPTAYGLKLTALAKFVSWWGSPTRLTPTTILDQTGGIAKMLWMEKDGRLHYNNDAPYATGTSLSGTKNTDALGYLVEAAVPAGKAWARYPQRAIPDPLGPTWNVGLSGRTDESAAIQALLDANRTVQLEPRAYYINQPIYLQEDQTLMGTRDETIIVAMRNDLDMIKFQFGGTRNNLANATTGLINLMDLTLQGGNSGFHQAQAGVQLSSHTIAYVTFRDMVTAGMYLDHSFGMDNGWIEYVNFYKCGTGVLQRGNGEVESPPEMYSDKTPFYRCQFIECGKGLDLAPRRSNNMMAYIECLFKDCTSNAMLFGGAMNYPVFVNCQYINCGGTTMIESGGNALPFVGCYFEASTFNSWIVGQGITMEGCTLSKGANNTVTLMDPERASWQTGFNYTTVVTNSTSTIPLGNLIAGKVSMSSVNSQWPVGDTNWSTPLSHIGYNTVDTPFLGDDVRYDNRNFIQGAISPGTRFLTDSYNVSTTPPVIPVDPTEPLVRWKSGNSVAGKRVTFLGDSTTMVASAMFERLRDQITAPGGEWAGAVVTQLGYNGQTVDGFLNQSFQDLVATNPALVVVCFGLNNVRNGGDSTATLQGYMRTLIERIQTQIPLADIVLWTPNSMLSTDPQGFGTVTPVSSAQDYTDRIWNAHNNIKVLNPYERVAYLDKQQVFGRVCQPTSPLMNDILHPSLAGQRAALEPLIELARPVLPALDLTASAAAWAANPTSPWLVYPRALDDDRYAAIKRHLVIGTYYDAGNNNLILYFWNRREDASALTTASIATGDILWTPNGVYTITGTESKGNLPDNGLQMSVPLNQFPPNVPAIGDVRVYTRGGAVAPTLSPTSGSFSFVAGAASKTENLAAMTTGSLASIASVTPALPSGLAATIVSGALKVSGTAAAAAASAAYVIVVNKTGGGTVTYTLTLVVTAAPVGSGYVFNADFDSVSSGASSYTDETGTVWTATGGATLNGVIPSGGGIQTVTPATLAAAELDTGPFTFEVEVTTTAGDVTFVDFNGDLPLMVGTTSGSVSAFWSNPSGWIQASLGPYGLNFAAGTRILIRWWRDADGLQGTFVDWANLPWGNATNTTDYGAPAKITLGTRQADSTNRPFVGTIHKASLKKSYTP